MITHIDIITVTTINMEIDKGKRRVTAIPTAIPTAIAIAMIATVIVTGTGTVLVMEPRYIAVVVVTYTTAPAMRKTHSRA